jgi:hypothetical protein
MAMQLIEAVQLVTERLLFRQGGRLSVPIRGLAPPFKGVQSSLDSRKFKQQVGFAPFRSDADFFALSMLGTKNRIAFFPAEVKTE